MFTGCGQYKGEPVLEGPILTQEENAEESDVNPEAIPENNEDLIKPEDDFKYAIVKDDTEFYIIQKAGVGSWKEVLQMEANCISTICQPVRLPPSLKT